MIFHSYPLIHSVNSNSNYFIYKDMKFECVQEQLLIGAQLVERVAGKHATLPVLSCILLVAQKNSLILRATNLEFGIEYELPAKVSAEGVAAIPAGAFSNTIAGIYNSANVTCELEENNITISTSSSKTIIKTLQSEDFPSLPTVSTKPIRLGVADFLRGIKSVWYSASPSTIKPEIGSVYIYPESTTLVFVATDSFRLAEKIITTQQSYEFEPILLPVRSVPEIIRVLERTEGSLEVRISEHQISFTIGNIFLTSRLTQGTFPDYRQIIPKNYTSEVIVLKQDLVSSLRKTAIFSGKFNQVSLHIHPKKKVFSVSARSDIGENNDSISGAISGEELDISFNLKYLTDSFSSLSGDSVSLSAAGQSKPLVVRDAADKSFLYLVMPMNR